MSKQAGFIARLMRKGKIDDYDAWWVRGEDWRAAKKEADAWRMKAEANQRYLDEARGHLAVRTSLSVTLGEKVHDLESKLAAANLLVATLREQVTAIIWAQHHQLKDDIEEWRSAAASRSAQVRNLEKQLLDEKEEHAEVVGKYSHKVDDLEELLNDERNEYEIVLGEKCSLLSKVESLKETVEELTGKVALLEEEQRVVVEPDEEEVQPIIEVYTKSKTEQVFITPVAARYKKTGPCSRRDWDEQEGRARAGEQVMWDGPPANRPQPHKGDLMTIWRNNGVITIYTITEVLDPSQRLDSWADNVGQQDRSVVFLSSPKEVKWSAWIKMGGHKRCQGTRRIVNVGKDIIEYYHNHPLK